MPSIKHLTALFLLLFSTMAYSESESEQGSTPLMERFKYAVDTSWENKITPLTKVAGEKWASLMTSTSIDTETLQHAIKETWNNTLKDSYAGKEMSSAGSAISNFLRSEITDTTHSASQSAQLFKQGKMVDGLWYLSTHIITDTNDNLATAVQQSELINTLGKITATSYAGPQGAAAYASWYTYKETNDPAMALKVGIASGSTNAGLSITNENSASELLKNRIISGVMAGLTAAVGGEDEKTIKEAFLKTSTVNLIEKQSNKIPDKDQQNRQKPENQQE
jgi:hypothetical protein